MKTSIQTILALAGAGLLSSCESNVQGPDTIGSGTTANRIMPLPNVLISPVSMTRNVEAQTLTLNYTVLYTNLMGFHYGYQVDAQSQGTGIMSIAFGDATAQSLTISLPTAMGSNYGLFTGSNFIVSPNIRGVYPYSSTFQPAIFSILRDRPSSLRRGDGLFPGECMVSGNAAYKLCMQPDGNLVETDASGSVLWSTAKAGGGASTFLLSSSGRLSTRLASGAETWGTGTGWTTFTLTNSGSLMLYKSGLFARISYIFVH